MAFDVVTVPNFTGEAAATFEARTLMFLASWIEHAGTARQFPLHIASIGEPPASVRRLAEQCGARISVHAPMRAEPIGYANKLRGLEVERETDRVLLLDTDVLTLADPSELAGLGRCLAAMPAIWPRVPEEHWRRIYAELNLEAPVERIASLTGALNRAPMRQPLYPAQNSESKGMIPYFNSGVVYAPWDCDLRPLWEMGIRHTVNLFGRTSRMEELITGSDQSGLALAVELLKRAGVPFCPLPYPFHVVWLHVYRRAVPLKEARFFHAIGQFGGLAHIRDWQSALRRYRVRLVRRMIEEWAREMALRPDARTATTYFWPALRDQYRLGLEMQRLFGRHAAPALRLSS